MRVKATINTNKHKLTLFDVTKKYSHIIWTTEGSRDVMYIFYKPNKHASVYRLVRYYLGYGLVIDTREYLIQEVEIIYKKYADKFGIVK